MFSTDEIKKVTLNDVMNTFKWNAPHDDVDFLVTMVNEAHDNRMVITDEEDIDVTEDDFNELLSKVE